MEPNRNLILGIDVGGTGIKGGIVDIIKGEMVSERFKVATQQPATPTSVVAQIFEIINHFTWTGSVGIGFPAVVDNGVVYSASNIHDDWINTRISDLLNRDGRSNIFIANDADVAGLAELNFGVAKGRKGKVLLLTIGTGIGSALIVNGQLVTNTELGHLYMKGHKKIAEKYASNAAREREELKWKAWAKRFNEYLNYVNHLCYPDLIVLGGGISKHFHKYGDHFDLQHKVVPAELKNFAGIVGAALYAQQQLDLLGNN